MKCARVCVRVRLSTQRCATNELITHNMYSEKIAPILKWKSFCRKFGSAHWMSFYVNSFEARINSVNAEYWNLFSFSSEWTANENFHRYRCLLLTLKIITIANACTMHAHTLIPFTTRKSFSQFVYLRAMNYSAMFSTTALQCITFKPISSRDGVTYWRHNL